MRVAVLTLYWRRGPSDQSNTERSETRTATRCQVWIGAVALTLLLWSVGSSICTHPHSLAYFNEFAGGADNGPAHLINSNVDWGQDLLLLEDWINEQPVDAPVHLAFFNYYNPFDLQIRNAVEWPFPAAEHDEPREVPDGMYAISVNLLYEYPWDVRAVDGKHYRIDNRPLGHLRNTEPVGRAGYSIRIYSAEQVRAAYAAPAIRLLSESW